MIHTVILAAGKGTRMRSDIPKVLHALAGKSFIQHVIDSASELGAEKHFVVVGHGADQVKQNTASAEVCFVEQNEQLGTGHAVQQVMPYFSEDAVVLILYGDVPLIQSKTLHTLTSLVDNSSMALLTVNMEQPEGYGRIVRDEQDNVCGIVEQKDASEIQKTITEVNTGVMAIRGADLKRWLPMLKNDNAQKEFYLTDIVSIASNEGKEVRTAQPSSVYETLGVNDRRQQAALERIYQKQLAHGLMEQGLTLLDPARFDCRGVVRVGKDCVVDVNCVFEGEVILGDGVYVGPNCHIKDSKIASGVNIKSHTVIDQATVGAGAVVGPFARLRPDAELGKNTKVGNFVEIKKATLGENSKVNHLSYVGDASLGADVNIGAGTITCNYDGKNKFKTQIGDGVFVGSNTALVAPIALGANVTVAAGSVITTDVKDDALAVARSRQRNIESWVRPPKAEQ
ncbi:MAG: bifunctional UDP-N-acetylglucosamine diphosphorylase/glucosamine-1-phosphate N-acetyltransferase GlmU [Agarilytica sp.]